MRSKSYLIFLVSAANSLCSQIDSATFDLSSFHRKAGRDVSYRIADYSYREKFCVLKTNDSLEYILKPDRVHGPFKGVSNFHNESLFEVETMNGVYSTYSTRFNRMHEAYAWADAYVPELTRSITLYTYNPDFGTYIFQQDGRTYGPYKRTPGLLWSNDTSTIYQVFQKDNRHFELFRNRSSLGRYKLYKCRHCGEGDQDIVYPNMFTDLRGRHFLAQQDSLFGPLKTLKHGGIWYMSGNRYFTTYLVQYKKEDFCRLFLGKKDLGFQLTKDAIGSYIMFPDSSLLFDAGYLKQYEFLKDEDELYFYHSAFGLISPPPVEKHTLIYGKLEVKIISNTLFYLRGFDGEKLKDLFIYKKNKLIDALSKGFSVIDNTYFYEKNGQYYMDGRNLNLPKNDAFCVFQADTFYVIKTGAKTWDLYKNRIRQQTQKVDIIDNIHSFHFSYYPLEKQLILGIETGYDYSVYWQKQCPNGCFLYEYDVYKNKPDNHVNGHNSEWLLSLYGESRMSFRNNVSFIMDRKRYFFNSFKSDDYTDEWGWHSQELFLKKQKAALTIYALTR